MRRIAVFAVTTASALAASTGAASAAQPVCVGGPNANLTTPDAAGNCKRGSTLTRLATEAEAEALRTRVSALEGQTSALESENSALKTRTAALESKLSKVRYDAAGTNGKPTLTIDGANLQLLSGAGATDAAVNGLGNLIIGYAEKSATIADESGGVVGGTKINSEQTGSHNLVLGRGQTFTSFGGLIGGVANTLSGPFASALGALNTASGEGASSTGGRNGVASGRFASVTGGAGNQASGRHASVTGGIGNEAGGEFAWVGGGLANRASGRFSSVSGGTENTASGETSSILGGRSRVTPDFAQTSPATP